MNAENQNNETQDQGDALVRHLDLFSGIGGFALAAKWAGWETIGFSEVNDEANEILARQWPDVPNLGDIRKMQGVPCDILTGGFPCQPYSVAGKKLGEDDPRDLWPQMLRIIKESRPTWIIGENSPNIRSMVLDKIIDQLENEGFSCRTFDIPACGLNAWHKRSRYWIVAYSERNDNRRTNRFGRGDWEQAQAKGLGVGENGDWDSEPRVARMVYGLPGQSHRLRALGNAIVPQVAFELMKGINSAMVSNDPGEFPGKGE